MLLFSFCFSQRQNEIIKLEQALKTEKSPATLIKISLALSSLYMNKNPDVSMEHAQRALMISSSSHSLENHVNALIQIGKIELIKTNYDLALESFIKSLELNKEMADIRGTAISMLLIGDVYKEIGDYKRARNQFEQALKNGEKTKNNFIKALSNFSIGKLEYEVGNNNLSLQYLIVANELISLTNDSNLKADFSHELGHYYIKEGQLKNAIQVLIRSLTIYEILADKESQAVLCYELSGAYEKTGDEDKSLQYMKTSLSLAEETGMKAYIKMGYENLAKVYETKGDYRRAYEFLQYFSAIKDVSEINALEAKLELAKKNQKLLLLEEHEKTQKQIRTIRYLFFIVLLAIMLVFSGFMYYAYRQKSSMNVELEAANKKANKLRKDKEDFFAYTSHEIRTPLNAVVGMSQLLSETDLNKQQKHYLKTINSSTKNILFLVNDVLDLTKIEKGAIQLESIPFSLKEIINGICHSLSFKTRDKNVELTADIDSRIPELVLGDPVRVNQILLNLVDNAVKFTENGKVTIKLSEVMNSSESLSINFTIVDTGIGINEEKIDHIFDSFKQESSETTRQYGGTGLGLAISKELVHLMGGKLSVKSTYGIGSTFYFELVFKKAADKSKMEKSVTLENNDAVLLSDLSILLVDDNKLNRDVFYDLINNQKRNVKVDMAEDGIIAIEKLNKFTYDIVLMDLQMPNKDGFETAKHIRNEMSDNIKDIPIIAMTAHVLEGVSKKCLDVGMNDCISKPLNVKLLTQKINSIFRINDDASTSIIVEESGDKKKEGSVVDLSIIKKISKNKPEKIIKYIDLYLKSVPLDLNEMIAEAKALNYKNVGSLAHKIKSAVGYMGVEKVIPDLTELEKLTKKVGNSTEIVNIVSRVESILLLSIEELKAYKEQCLT